jgi:hypothetical protein
MVIVVVPAQKSELMMMYDECIESLVGLLDDDK